MKPRSFAAAVSLLGCCTAWATRIDVYQGSVIPDPSTYKGTIEAYAGSLSPEDNYDLFSHSAHPVDGPNLRFGRGQIFFYDVPGGTTFNLIFNKEKNGPSDPITDGRVNWNIGVGSGADAGVILSDDRRELEEEFPSPPLAPGPPFSFLDVFKGRWEWHNNTDGGIIGTLLPYWAVLVDPKLYEGIDALRVFSADGDRINLNLRTGDRGFMLFVLNAPDAGSTMVLLSAGLCSIALLRRLL